MRSSLFRLSLLLTLFFAYTFERHSKVISNCFVHYVSHEKSSFLIDALLSHNILLASLISILPIIAITLCELASGIGLLNTSIGKTFTSPKHRFADPIYYLFQYVGKFPLSISFITLGTASLVSSFRDTLNNAYLKYIHFPDSEISNSILILVAITLTSLIGYARHRLEHVSTILWDLHEFHHSSTQMNILANFKSLPLADVLTAPITLPILSLTTIVVNHSISSGQLTPTIIFLLDNFLLIIFVYLGHSSYKLIYPKPLSIFLMSPALHWIHHSSNHSQCHHNFGSTYCIWDRLFGTYLDESNLPMIKSFGFKHSSYNRFNPLHSYLVLPFNKIALRARKKQLFTTLDR